MQNAMRKMANKQEAIPKSVKKRRKKKKKQKQKKKNGVCSTTQRQRRALRCVIIRSSKHKSMGCNLLSIYPRERLRMSCAPSPR